MPHIDTMFPSKFLKASDLAGRDINVQIRSVTFEEMENNRGEPEQKPVLWFEKTEKGMVLNRTNGNTIAELHGYESDGWIGQLVTLYSAEVEAFGKMTDAIRVRRQPPTNQPAPAAQSVIEPPPAPEAAGVGLGEAAEHDDRLPF